MDTNKSQHQEDESGVTAAQKERSDIVVRKAEKLTTATYMVSDIIPDREPVKWKMRETAIELLSDITLSATASAAERLSYLRNVTKKIEKLVSFLEIAWTTRIISEMNASILREEFIALRELIDADIRELLSGRVDRSPALPPMYRDRREESMRTPERPARVEPPLRQVREESKQNVSAPSVRPQETLERKLPASQSTLPRVSEPRRFPDERPAAFAQEGHVTSQRHGHDADARIGRDDRRKIIQALLKQRSKLTVKDIAKSIPGFSEKTIQRELMAMLSDGQIVKEGEKRWTTYSLA